MATITRNASERYGNQSAIVTPDGWSLSFADLDRLSDEVACAWTIRGLVPGDVVTLLVPSGPEYLVSYLALAKIGAVTAGVNPLLSTAERRALVRLSGAGHVVVTSGDDPALEDIGPDVDVIEVGAADAPTAVMVDHLEVGCRPPELPLDSDRPIAIVFTSGTTGLPKGATFGERQFVAALEAERADPWPAGHPIISGTQFAHIGFMIRAHAYLEMGTALCLMARWRAADALALVQRHRMPVINGVSAQIALMLQVPGMNEMDLTSVSRIVTGGGPSTPDLIDEAMRRFAAPYTSRYSLTESGGMGTATAVDADPEERYHSVGRPRGGIEVRIGRAGEPLLDGAVGEICLRGPSVMTGYWNDPEATSATIIDGWLHTGDLGRVGELGVLYLAGRSKEMFIRGGYNVYPQEIEAVLNAHPGVGSIIIVPREDPVMGEIGVAVVIPRSDADTVTLAELREFARDRLAHYKLPEAIHFVDAFPVTAMQKVDRLTMAAMLRTQAS
jgi:acyl-CoA synthetase (AMP-forming)/AMP-acid ligase II